MDSKSFGDDDLDYSPTIVRAISRLIPNYQLTLLIAAFFTGTSVGLALFFKYVTAPPAVLSVNLVEQVLSWLLIAGVTLSILGFFAFIADKLGVIKSESSRAAEIESRMKAEVETLRREISTINSDLKQKIPEQQITTELQRLAESYFHNATFQKIEEEIENKHGTVINIAAKTRAIREGFSGSIISLSDQLSKQRTNANINLLLGLIFSTIGILVMGYFVYLYLLSESSQTRGLSQFIVFSFLPKFTFVVLVETVAFFFLNLYREDRNMIRYFRNEITNLESKYLALETSARFEDKQSLAKVLLILANTERNFLMKKNEKLIIEALREEDDRLFDKVVDKVLGVVQSVTRADPRIGEVHKKA